MFYIIYTGNGINILKCDRCKSYDLNIDRDSTGPEWSVFLYSCLNCGNTGRMKLRSDLQMENFNHWESLQERIDELKVVMGFTKL